MDHAVKVHREVTAPSVIGSRRRRLKWEVAIFSVLAAFSAYSWLMRPEFLWGPRFEQPPLVQDADARLAMVLLSQRLEARRAADGRYPVTLDAIGEQGGGIQYRLLSDTVFELRATVNGRVLMLRSTDNTDSFLGNSMAVIGGKAP